MERISYKQLNGLFGPTMAKWRARLRKEEARLGRRVTNDELLNILLTPKKLPIVGSVE